MTGPNKTGRHGLHGAVCLGTCSRVTRMQGTPVEDFPGTVSHSSRGRCQSCHRLHTGQTRGQIARKVDAHIGLSVYTPAQTKRVTALFGRDVEIMRMLGMQP